MLKTRLISSILCIIFTISIVLPVQAANKSGSRSFDLAQRRNDKSVQEFVKDEIILRLNGNQQKQRDFLKKQNLTVIRRDNKLNYVLAKTPLKTDIKKLVLELKKHSLVQDVQPNYIYQTFSKPNDPLYTRQWALQKINIEAGWQKTQGKGDVIIAVLDTGIDINHPDLKNNLVRGTNTVNPLKSARDDDGHGTHVAGIAAAASNNGVGISGVAGNCKIMPIKVFDYWGGSDISVSEGIIWAVDNGAKVINMSFGSWYRSPLLAEAIEYANEKGVVMVAAAGNWASDYISYPAALSQVIAVSATDKDDNLARFSSYGPEIDVCAPGDKVFSTFWDVHKGSTYRELTGTSMASPQVAGLAALLLSANPKLTSAEVRQIIEASAKDLGEPGWDPQYGHGRIDVSKALMTGIKKFDTENNSPDDALTLNSGRAVVQKLDYGADEDWYVIDVKEGESLQIELQPANLVTPAMEIYDCYGELLETFNVLDTSSDLGFWAYLFNRQSSVKVGEAVYGILSDLEEDQYFIRVFGNNNRWSDAEYTLKATLLREADLFKDEWEPNDEMEKAKVLSLGAKATGGILPSGDEDWYKVYLSPNQMYKVELDVPAGLDLAVEIFRDLANIPEEDRWYYDYFGEEYFDYGGQGEKESGVFQTYSETAGYYYFKISDSARGSVNAGYTFTVDRYTPVKDRYEPNDEPEEAKRISLNTIIDATFTDDYDEDWYEFEVNRTGILEVDLKADKFLAPDIYLFNEELEYMGSSEYYPIDFLMGKAGGESGPIQFKVSPGKYYLNLTNYWGLTVGNYSFKLNVNYFNFIDEEINDTYDRAVPIMLGQSKKGTIYPADDQDYYVLEVEEKGLILVNLTPPKGLDTYISVFKETFIDDFEGLFEGEEFPWDDEYMEEPYLEYITDIDTGLYGQADVGVFMASKPGRYYLAVGGWPDERRNTPTAPYTLTVNKFAPTPDRWESNDTFQTAKPIGNNAIFSPTFMGTEDKDWFKIWVPADSTLTVKLEVPNDIDGVIELFDSSGRWLTKADQAMVGEEEVLTWKIKAKGIYYIRVFDFMGNASVLPYTLNVKYVAEKSSKKKS